MLRHLVLLPLVVLCLAAPSFAQYTVGSITFKNAGDYKQTDLEAVAGLHQGSSFDKGRLEKAIQNLSDTGLFDDIQYLTEGQGGATNITFDLTPTDSKRLVDITFGNLPWWTDAEIIAALQPQVPLFHGSVPEAGSLRNAVQAALVKLIATKGITATVASVDASINPAHPVHVIRYYISSPAIQLRTVHLDGVPPELNSLVNSMIAGVAGKDYSVEGNLLEDGFAATLKDAGYFDASASHGERTISGTGPIFVDMKATLQPGELYRVSHIDFTGTPIVSAADAQHAAKLHADDPATRIDLLATLSRTADLYGHLGYITADFKPVPSIDKEAHRVAYNITINPGPQYRLRTVTTTYLPQQDTGKFQSTFKLKPGDIYDTQAITAFSRSWLSQHASVVLKPFQPVLDKTTHEVDLTFTFAPAH